MRASEPGTARQEAERLVATAVAAARLAAGGVGHRGAGSTCCACPICRALAALREPDPRAVERLATRAGDVAAGVAGLLRSATAGRQPTRATGDDEVWREATRAGQTGAPRRQDDAWAAATRTDHDRTDDVPPVPRREA